MPGWGHGVAAEAAFEQIKGALDALARRFGVAVTAFDVDPEDAHQRGCRDERFYRVRERAGFFGEQCGEGLLEAGKDLSLVAAQCGAAANEAQAAP